MSGMNSGLDTESIIKALTANSKLKVTKQERNVLKYEATQTAYRDIIGKMQNIKSKYFDLLNKDSYLSGTSMWSKYASKTYDASGNETNIKGLSVTTGINSQAGDYDFEILETATQSKVSGAKLTGSAGVDLDEITGQTNSDGSFKELGITVNVGGEEKNITFMSGATKEETANNLNAKLEEAFGESNTSAQTTGTSADYKGMVFIDEVSGKLTSRDSKAVTISGVGTMKTDNELDLTNAKAGTNNISFQVGDKTLNVSFQTIDKDYFKSAIDAGLISESTGEILISDTDKDEDGNYIWHTKSKETARAELGDDASDEEVQARANEILEKWDSSVQIFKATADDYKESIRYEAFKAYINNDADSEETKAAKMESLYQAADAENKKTRITKWLEDGTGGTHIQKTVGELKEAYETYKSGLAEGEEADDIYTWASTSSDSDVQSKLQLLENAYEGTGNGEIDYDSDFYNESYKNYKDEYAANNLSDTAIAAYNSYRAQVEANGGTTAGLYEWATTDSSSEAAAAKEELDAAKANEDTPFKDFEAWKSDFTEKESWHLNKDTWALSESNQFAAYKSSVYTEPDSYGITAEKMYTHFTESSIKNSIGKLEVDGVKFDASFDSTNGTVSISAYTEETTTADDGTETTTKTPVAISMTIGKNSANSAEALGLTASSNASSQISQISNATKLSEIMDSDDGTYKFDVNGQSFTFDGETTINDMMKKVNASSAGVKMSFSSLSNQFTVTSSAYGVDGKTELTDTSGLLKQLGLTAAGGATATQGTNLRVSVTSSATGTTEEYESSGNTIEADGTTFTIAGNHQTGEQFSVSISQDTSAIADVIKGFVEDYNKLIEDVYKYLDEKPEKDYYFLADADKEDLELSEKQEEKWEEKAKKGLLYHDSTTTQIMTKLRTALMGSVEGLDGNRFSLLDLGIKTSSDYNKHGMITGLDVKTLTEAIETHGDDIMKLFTDSENGIMKKFSEALDSGINSNGDNKGTLIKKAGLASGTSSTDNEIYRAIKRTKTKISSLNMRYENEQDRLWKRYSNMESLLGTMNSQQSSFMSYFAQ